VLTDRERVLPNQSRVSAMAEDEHCRACVEKDALIDTLKAEMAALKTTHRKEMAAMEKRLSQSGEAVMWAELPKELLGMVLDKLQQRPLAGGVEGSKHVRLVSREWRDCHDALVTRLTVSWRTTDEGMWLLVRRFPSVVSLEVKYNGYYLTDEGMKAVSTFIGLTSLTLATATR
jgi:hypothetical protein